MKGLRIKPSGKVWHRKQQQEDEFGEKTESQTNNNTTEVTGLEGVNLLVGLSLSFFLRVSFF